MAYDPRSIANYILTVRMHFGYVTTQLELQKLLYFCHGQFLSRFGAPLIDGYFEAWEHGPVHPLIYKEFREFGAQPITKRSIGTNLITGERRMVAAPKDKQIQILIAETVLQLRHLSASQLREKSHAPGGPWHSVWQTAKTNVASGVRIPDNVIMNLYHRHILPVELGDKETLDVQDYPPESDRGGEHFGAAIPIETTNSRKN